MAHTLSTPPPGRFLLLSSDGKSVITRRKAERWLRCGRAESISPGIIRLRETDSRIIAERSQVNRKLYFPADRELERHGTQWRWWKGYSGAAAVMKASPSYTS